MLKPLLILLVSIACILNASASKFGLETTKGEPLKLLKLKTKALVEGPYAEIQYIQTYKNPLDHAVETEFLFPRTDSSIFHKFEAVFQNQTIVGRVLEKETAKKMYEWNTQKGNTVAYSERNKIAPDVMNIKVGNIPANETVEIVFSVIQPLETIINKFYELRLPVVLTERYSPSSVDRENTPNIKTVETNHSLYKEWHIEVEIKSNSPFALLSNPTHLLDPELSEKLSGTSSKIYKAVWNATIIPNKDFVVYFGPQKLEKPETILATYPQEPNNHVLLINFLPDITTIQTSVVKDLLLKTSDGLLRLKRMAYEYDLDHAEAEFIFVIDRSGSMMGTRMENLRRALKKFLNAIPKRSYFNIISFGSNYNFYKPQSVLNSPEALEEALKWVFVLQADMGGTEILEPLKALTDGENRSTDLPKIVMILTDGDVFNPDEVINHIAANANKMRFCSIGIGSGASDYLVRNMAKAGKCRSEFVQDYEDIGDKALYMVQAATSQHVTDIKFDISCINDENQEVYTEHAELDLLMKDQPFNKWIYLENIPNLKSCHATLSYYNGLKSQRVTEEMDIKAYETEEITNFWHKIAYDAKIKELEQGIKMKRTSYQGEDAQSHIVKLSTKYQILSDHTSFLAVLQESTVNPNETAQKIIVPNMQTADYFANPRGYEHHYGEKTDYHTNKYRKASSSYGSRSSGVDEDLIVMGIDVDVGVDIELEYIGDGDCPEVDLSVGVDVDIESEEEGRERNDEIIQKDNERNNKNQNKPSSYGSQNSGVSIDDLVAMDNAVLCDGGDIGFEFEFELVPVGDGDCAEVDIWFGYEAEHAPGSDVYLENEEEGRERNDEIVKEDSETNSKIENIDSISSGWSCENADDASKKDCSQVENSEKQEEAQEKEEISTDKLAESSDLRLVNITNHAIHANLTEITNQANKISPQLSQKSEDKSSKILGFGSIGISFLVILLFVMLF